MHLEHPQSLQFYNYEELQHLIKALGFPRYVVQKNIPKEALENLISVDKLLELCDLRYFHRDLHYTFNLKPASYNVDTFKKCLLKVAEKLFSFSDLESIRLAYEAYEDFDQRGMRTDTSIIIKALKLCHRVIAPLKLTDKLRHLQPTYKEKGRIQFYEFLDLLSYCDFIKKKEKNVGLVGATEKTKRNIYCIDDMTEVLLTKDELLHKKMNREYLELETAYLHPHLKSKLFMKNPITSEHFDCQVKEAIEDYEETKKRLKDSKQKILRCKSGSLLSDNIDLLSPSLTPSSKKLKSISKSRSMSSKTKSGTASRRTSATNSGTFKSAPPAPVKPKEKQKIRAHSGPPIVNRKSRQEISTKMADLSFDILTEKQRWEKNTRDLVANYIYSPDDVLDRLNKLVPAPGVKKKRTKRRTQPSPRFTQRMAKPGPLLPHHHTKHCDAIAHGLGDDDHAKALQVHGYKMQVQQKKEKKTLQNSPKNHTSLLERLLSEDNDSSSVIFNDNKEDFATLSQNTTSNHKDESSQVVSQSKKLCIEEEDCPTNVKLASSESWKLAKFNEAYSLLKDDFSRICLNVDLPEDTNLHQVENYHTKGKSTVDIFSQLIPSSEKPEEESAFEKYLKTTKDFTIPLEELKKYDDVSIDWIKHRHSFRRLRKRSAAAKSEIQKAL